MDWTPWLRAWSEEWISVHEPGHDRPLDDDVLAHRWLGFAPAGEDDVRATQARLGRPLPPSLRDFLAVTDGWRHAGNFIHRLAGARQLAWLRDTEDAHWIEAFQGFETERGEDSGDVLARSLRLSTDGDAAVLLLDPGDVDSDGEWAGYWLSSWSGEGPRRFESFAALMRHLYASFHALRHPAGPTAEHWDSEVERAWHAALAGDVTAATAVLREAAGFGRFRAEVLLFQLLAMQDRWYDNTIMLSWLPLREGFDELDGDPFFTNDLLPVLYAEDRLMGRHERFTLGLLTERGAEWARRAIADHDAARHQPGYQPRFGNPEFDAVAHEILRDLRADPSTENAWPRLREAMRQWRPASRYHVAPLALLGEPLFAQLITGERGRDLLSIPRGTS